MEVLKPHLFKVYNNRKEKSTLKSLNDSIDDAGVPPTFAEFEPDLEGLANDKAPGENGVIPNLIKALDTDIREIIYNEILEFWNGEIDFESWHRSLLKWVHKAGRDPSSCDNYRGISLMDVTSKILCRMINRRLFKVLKIYGTEYQFGGTPEIGCCEGIFTLKTFLHARRSHGLSTHVAFIDLVKAYDTIDHKLLILVLENYGVPEPLRRMVATLYENLVISFLLGKN